MTYLYWSLTHPVVGPPFQVQDMCRQRVLLRGQHYEAGQIVALIHVLYIILEHVSFNIMFCIKSDVFIWINGPYVAIFTPMWTRCGRCIILGQVAMKLQRLYFG